MPPAAPPPPPPPPPYEGCAAAVARAVREAASRSDADFLDAELFQTRGCMRLVLDLEAAVAVVPEEVAGAAGSAARGRFLCRVLHATMQQHVDWLAGVAAAPSRRQYHELSSVHALPRRGDQAEARLVRALREQFIPVQVADVDCRVPVRSVLGHLPADHCRLVLRHVPPEAAVVGVTEAVLAAAGYGEQSGVVVVHERAAVAPAVGWEGFSLPVLDTVVATVRVPPEHVGLPRLPRALPAGGYLMTAEVEDSVVPTGQLVLRQLRPVQDDLPEVQHPGVRPAMARVYASGGLQRQPAVAGGPAGPSGARPPGVRTGLGFVPAAAAAAALPAVPAAAAAAAIPAVPAAAAAAGLLAQPAGAAAAAAPAAAAAGAAPPLPPPAARAGPQELMPPAAPEAQVPLDEPGFGAACQLVLEGVDDSTPGEAQVVVQQARTAAPAAYADAAQAATPGELPRAFRVALHAQACLQFGRDRAEPLRVLAPEGLDGLPEDADALLGLQDMAADLPADPPAAALVAAQPPELVAPPARRQRTAAGRPPAAAAPPAPRRSGRDRDSGDWMGLQQAALGGAPTQRGASTSRGGGMGRPRTA